MMLPTSIRSSFGSMQIVDGFGLAGLLAELAAEASPAVEAALRLCPGRLLVEDQFDFFKALPLLHGQRGDGHAHLLLYVEGHIDDELVLFARTCPSLRSLPSRKRLIDSAASCPWSTASMAIFGPVTISPPAKTPGTDVSRVTASALIQPPAEQLETWQVRHEIRFRRLADGEDHRIGLEVLGHIRIIEGLNRPARRRLRCTA